MITRQNPDYLQQAPCHFVAVGLMLNVMFYPSRCTWSNVYKSPT